MKFTLLTLVIAVLLSLSVTSQNYEIYIDTISHTGMVGNTDLTGYNTYRVFARSQDPSEFISGVIGDTNNPVTITTSTSFFQADLGSLSGANINSGLITIFPEVEFDSYVTIGHLNTESYGIPFVDNPIGSVLTGVDTQFTSTAEDPNNGWTQEFESGGDIIIDTFTGGAWFVTPTGNAGYPLGNDNSVLVGQFTTDGDFYACLNYIVISNIGTPDQDGYDVYGGCASANNYGCTDSLACNYDVNATEDDFSCYYTGDSCNDQNSLTDNDVFQEDCSCAGTPGLPDDCANATPITIDGGVVFGDNTGAQDENDADENNSGWGTDGDEGDVWFSFVGDGGLVDIETINIGGNIDTQIAIYGSCSSQSLASNDDGGNLFMSLISGFCTEVDQVYFIEAEGWNGSVGGFNIEVTSSTVLPTVLCDDMSAINYSEQLSSCQIVDNNTCAYPSTNDSCEDAIALIVDGDVVQGSNVGASATADASSGSISAPEVWYSFIGTGGLVSIETTDLGDFDTQLVVWDECEGIDLAYNDDGGEGYQALISGFCSELGEVYTIELQGWNGQTGNFAVQVYTSEINSLTAMCSDPLSCNYDESWACSDEFCIYPGDSCNDYMANTENDTYNENCECVGDYAGCMDATACNFDENASSDDDSCVYPGDSCDDQNDETSNDTLSSTCECTGELSGCTDSEASNYNPEAVIDNGTCCYGGDLSVVLYDGFGDGGSSFVLQDNFENEVLSGALQTGAGPETESGCIDSGCYIFTLIPDNWPDEISAQILLDGEVLFEHVEGDSFDQYPILINIGDDPECLIYGCTDETACNYGSLVTTDDGSCEFTSCVGCSIPGASNYSDQVTQDDGSCSWNISGVVFIDDNYNGILDPFEETLPYQYVALEPSGTQIITDDNGEFIFEGLAEGEYYVSVFYTDTWTTYTTETIIPVSFPLDGGSTVYFGVTNEATPAPSACVDFYQWGVGVPCNDLLYLNICYRNMSPYPISGVVEVQLDDLLTYNSSNTETTPVVDGQTITWEFTDLSSWMMNFDDLIVDTPDETHMGEFMTSHVTIYAWENGVLIPLAESTMNQEVTCSWDPNDITGIPEGYTDDHLVLPDTRMEYLIRFQNTGNAPAGQVMVVDTLDVDMDPSTFQLVANSHSVMTTIHPSGRVEFLFENINLPDSTENEPESHGLVSFKIDFRDDVSIGEEINSTAHIFFDNNPAVITNTTWHTIHECGGEADFEASATEICRGETVTFTGTSSLVEEHTWNVDAASSGTESAYSSEFTEAGDYIIQLVAENPLCNASTMQMLTVHDLPEAEITESGAILTSNEGDSYQWYLNSEVIDSATEQTFEALDDGNYTVEVTNENECSTLSSSVMIVNIEELTALKLELFPNPMEHNSTLTFDTTREKTIRLTDPQGKLIRTWNGITDQTVEIERGTLTAGKYYITVEEEGKSSTIALVVR